MAPNIMGTQLILNVDIQLNVSKMVPLSAQPRKTLARVTLTINLTEHHSFINFENPPMFPRTPISLYFTLMTRGLNKKQ